VGAFTIEITRPAQRQLRKLDPKTRARVAAQIDQLTEEPRPAGARLLRAAATILFRIREGDYRIVYRVEDERLLVLVVKKGHRSEVYR